MRPAAARLLFLAFAAAFFLHPPLAEAPVAQGNPHAKQENHCQHSKIHFYLIVDKPLVCQRICPTACLRTVSPTAAQCSGASHRPRLRRRGVPALRTPFGRVLAPPAASRPPTASGRDGNAFLRFAPTLNSAWSSHTFAPPCASACAVFRPCGLRFAPCPRGSSRFAASDARKLTCGTPCFIGLTSACFAHCARPSCAPAVHAAGDDFNAKGFRLSRALLEFLTVCGTVKEQPKFLHSRKMPSGLQAEFPLPPPL